MKIILIGFMVSGKTTIAPIIAKKLSLRVIETDDIIKKLSGKTTGQIFKEDGEVGYRELEIAAAKSIKHIDNVVISTGGGVVMNKIILDYLKENSKIIFLDTSFKTLLRRLDNKIPRPLFKNIEEAEKLYNLRYPLYKTYADIIIKTDNKTYLQTAEEIISLLNI